MPLVAPELQTDPPCSVADFLSNYSTMNKTLLSASKGAFAFS